MIRVHSTEFTCVCHFADELRYTNMAEGSDMDDYYYSQIQSYLLVAAFDFGTTYSGYALSFRDDPTRIQVNQKWISGSQSLISLKTPTCVLLNPRGEFDAFGFEAENKYVSLACDDLHNGWRLFRNFKMVLHNNKVSNDISTCQP